MTTVAATQVKTNFRHYTELVENGEPIMVKRPKGKKNIVMITEEEYALFQRILVYHTLMKNRQESAPVPEDIPEMKIHGLNSAQREAQYKAMLNANFKHKTLSERYAEFQGPRAKLEEFDWGERVGKEIW